VSLGAKIIIVVVLIVLSVFLYLIVTGPHMVNQPHIIAYRAIMPLPPPGSVPVEKPTLLPSTDAALTLANPLDATSDNVARGKLYYGYYCGFCHGDKGDGYGPVGESYVPVPSDLRTKKVRSLKDGELLRAMLLGAGHEPVLEKVVPVGCRWYLVLYVRSLGAEPAKPAAAGAGIPAVSGTARAE